MNARWRFAWLPLGLVGGLLLIAAGHFLGLFPTAETIPPVRVHHTFPPRITTTNFQVEHVFEVRNPSRRRAVRILDTKTSCGCLVAELSKKVLAPGEATTMRISADVPLSNEVNHRSTVDLHTDLAEQPHWIYGISVDRYSAISVLPRQAFFGKVRPKVDLRKTLSIEVHQSSIPEGVPTPAFELSEDAASLFSVEKIQPPVVHQLPGNIQRWTFAVELIGTSGHAQSEQLAELRVRLPGHDATAVQSIPISWSVQGPVWVEPSEFSSATFPIWKHG